MKLSLWIAVLMLMLVPAWGQVFPIQDSDQAVLPAHQSLPLLGYAEIELPGQELTYGPARAVYAFDGAVFSQQIDLRRIVPLASDPCEDQQTVACRSSQIIGLVEWDRFKDGRELITIAHWGKISLWPAPGLDLKAREERLVLYAVTEITSGATTIQIRIRRF